MTHSPKPRIAHPTEQLYCCHSHYADGHCAEMICWNYYSKCPKHSISGSVTAKCSQET